MKYPLHVQDMQVKVAGAIELPVTFCGSHMALEGKDSFRSFPSGHFAANEVEFSAKGELLGNPDSLPRWLVDNAQKALFGGVSKAASYSVVARRSVTKPVVLLNCLDSCYGHCLYKLANVLRLEQEPGYDIVVIVHPSFVHLVPDSVAEMWIVKAPFHDLDFKLEGFHEYVAGQLQRFEGAELAQAFMNLDFEKLDFTRLTKVSPFNFRLFADAPVNVTFVLRSDRFWIRGRFDNLFYLACLKFGWLPFFRDYFASKERRHINGFVRQIRKRLSVEVSAVGIGKAQGMRFLDDKRVEYAEFVRQEERWLEVYAQSHICIGVHGSNMLLPSFLAGAYISLLPDFKIDNFSEDYIPRKEPLQKALFLCRTLPTETSPRNLARHVATMWEGWTHGIRN